MQFCIFDMLLTSMRVIDILHSSNITRAYRQSQKSNPVCPCLHRKTKTTYSGDKMTLSVYKSYYVRVSIYIYY